MPSIAPSSVPNSTGGIASSVAVKPPMSALISIAVLIVMPPTKPANPASVHQSQNRLPACTILTDWVVIAVLLID
jgi:hypothetical protein